MDDVEASPRLGHGLMALAAAAVLVVGGGAAFALLRDSDSGGSSEAVAGLPDTPDYHSLLVSPGDARRLVLGTHEGLFESADGGQTWAKAGLERRDAMNLVRSPGRVLWAAGHGVLAKSTDGGKTWSEVSPPGLPYLDVHGFAVDPRNPDELYAAIANSGLYRSTDGGASFELLTREVGGSVFALAVTRDGRILAGDARRGLLASGDAGKSWAAAFEAPVLGLAVNPKRPGRILAAGPATYLSTDAGRTWDLVLAVNEGAGPVAWAPSEPDTAYLVGFDRTLYRSGDGGRTFEPVGA